MNKKEWLEAALRKIDSMGREEFEAALKAAMLPRHHSEESSFERYAMTATLEVDGCYSSVEIGHAESSPFENQWLTLFSKNSHTAPNEALYSLLAA